MLSSRPYHRLRKFRFERPQKIAALLLLIFLGECLWVCSHRYLSASDYQYARCGREMWEHPEALPGYFTTCGNFHDGTLAWRAAGLPLTVQRILAGKPSTASPWALRHELTDIDWLLRLPFVLAGLVLGACLWWVTRRLFGNPGGYISLALYCFQPSIIRASTIPNNEILAAFGLFATIYTAIGVGHALQGPRRKWRTRIILLTLALGFTAAAHIAAFLLALVFSIAFLAWVAEGRRAYIPTLLLIWVPGALVLLFASYAFSPDAFSYVFRSSAGRMWLTLDGAHWFFANPANAAFTIALAGCLILYAAARRSRYFGNTTPLIVGTTLMFILTTGVPSEPWLWALPFLIIFVGGIFADALETRWHRVFVVCTWIVVAAQAALCCASLPGLTG